MNNNKEYNLYATAAFGLEGIVGAELKRLKMQNVRAELGGARFTGTLTDAFLCNLRLRSADRVLIVLAEDECRTFEELFQLVKSIAWEDIMPADAKINVSGKCVRSQLMSVRDCQAITKKAIIERLKAATHRAVFPETGAVYPIDVAIHSDRVRITLDTSGEALNRRVDTAPGTAKRPCAKRSLRLWWSCPHGGRECACTTPAAAQARC
ncbi:MAG: THUMP domain-containing protein [Christensenellales bacterium]